MRRVQSTPKLEVIHIADSDHPGAARSIEFFDRAPDLRIFVAKTGKGIRTVKEIRIHPVGLQMLEGPFEGLQDLSFQIGLRIIGYPVILAVEGVIWSAGTENPA